MTELSRTEVLVVGGGLGGVAAALALTGRGRRVVLTEATDWLGGQLTSQGVPPDESPWIERFGCNAGYRRLRAEIRDHYRRFYPLTDAARRDPHLNPGRGSVSGLCVEPRVAACVVHSLLAPAQTAGLLHVLLRHHPIGATTCCAGERVRSVTLRGPHGQEVEIAAEVVLDATETGELLEPAQVEHRTGAESWAMTGEPSAPQEADPLAHQAISWCFAMDHVPGEDFTGEEPDDYQHWRTHTPGGWTGGPMLSLTAPVPRTGEPAERTFEPDPAVGNSGVADHRTVGADMELWTFRRIAARETFVEGFLPGDITLVNWPMIDYLGGPVYGQGPEQAERHLQAARGLSLSFLHWLRTEVPRPDGGHGWPGLRLRGDVLGTRDGLAKAPYVRESRRIQALTTLREQDVALSCHPSGRPPEREDSVGIGSYRIDLHPTVTGRPYLDVASCPFQIPLGALVPVRVSNLLPAAKNLGTTHITNGCARLHPVEWAVGEAAGHLAAHVLDTGHTPQQVAGDPRLIAQVQKDLVAAGVELSWPQEARGY